jgi:hypothetical protein
VVAGPYLPEDHMLGRVRAHFMRQPVAYLALFVALGGTGAYAADTIGSDDVINNSLLSEDVQNGTLGGVDLRENTIGSARIVDDSLVNQDIKNGTIGPSDIAANSLGGGRITDNSLKGADVDEGSLTGVKISGFFYVDADSGDPDSTSPKSVFSEPCPPGSKVIDVTFDLSGAKSGEDPNVSSSVTIDAITTFGDSVLVEAYESQPTDATWRLFVTALCANAE